MHVDLCIHVTDLIITGIPCVELFCIATNLHTFVDMYVHVIVISPGCHC